MKMKNNLYIICIALLVCNSMVLRAQVTIGSGHSPAKGLLLQLKDTEPTDPDANNETAAKGGLILPRVDLVKTNTLEPFITNATPDEMKAHEGLMVYNTNRCLNHLGNDNGVYGWYGTSWLKMGEEEELAPGVYEVIDLRDDEVYLARNFGATAGDWMLENMRYVPKAGDGYSDFTHTAGNEGIPYTAKYYAYSEGDEIPYVPINHPSAEWRLKKKNGLFYNWAGATNGENLSTANQQQTAIGTDPVTTPIRGICPLNWHIPSDKEWNDLEREIYNNAHLYSTYTETEKSTWPSWDITWETGGDPSPGYGFRPRIVGVEETHGMSMKSPCTPVGSTAPAGGKSFTVTQGGFAIPLVGYPHDGDAKYYGNYAYFWTSSSGKATDGWSRGMRNIYGGVNRISSWRYALLSVRCKKN